MRNELSPLAVSQQHARFLRPRSRRVNYGFAVLLSLVALLVTLLVPPVAHGSLFLFFMLAVTVSALQGGIGPGLLTTALGALGGVFLSPPEHMLRIHNRADLARLAAYLVAALLACGLSARLRSSRFALLASERWFSTTLHSIGDALIATDAEGRVIFMNHIAVALTGWTLAEAMHRPLHEIFRIQNEDTGAPVEDPVGKVLRMGAVVGLANHTVLVAKSGAHIPIDDSGAPIRNEAGEIAGVVLVFRDISERHHAEKALRESESRFRRLAESNAIGIVTSALDGRVLDANDAFLRLVGYTREELLSGEVRLDKMIPPEYRDLEADAIVRLRERGVHTPWEKEYLTKDGSRVSVLVGLAMLEGSEDKCLRFVLDITERKRVEEVMRATEKLAATGRLAATIAHEINNPLESVTNLLYLLEHHTHLDSTARQYAELAQKELARVVHIARQTLAFYRETSKPVAVDLVQLLDDVVDLYCGKIERRKLKLEKRYDSRAKVQGFSGELRQVFSNLLINALDAVAEGGTVRLHVRHSVDWSNMERQGVRVFVTDDGPGIAREHRQKIFEPFFTTKGDKGTGLGLWVTHGIVRKHGGTVHVRSSVNPERHGTVFSVFLPGEASRAARARGAVAA